MSDKIKILIANDASYLPTGYGVYGQELLSRLNKTGKYEIAELACYARNADVANYTPGWTVYPGMIDDTEADEVKKAFGANYTTNSFGSYFFSSVLLDFQPDIVFDMRDYWMYAYQEIHPYRNFYKWVVMPTVDSAPQKTDWLNTFANMDLVVPYTEWAKETLTEQCKASINLFDRVANAGVDLDVFKPLLIEEKKELKQKFFGRDDLLITGVVMRNQKRKLFSDVFQSYSIYLNRLLEENDHEKFDKSFLYLHTTWPEQNGWDLPSLLLEHNLLYKTYLTSVCKNCKNCFATKFHEGPIVCPSCKKQALSHCGTHNGLDTSSLVKVYQVFDLFMQMAICEGFGMPQIEAAACGVPIMSTDYSAMSEIVRNLEGRPIALQNLFRELETGADRAYPNIFDAALGIYDFFILSEEEKQKKSKRTRELCEHHYSWDRCAEVWDAALSSVDLSDKLPWDAPLQEVKNSKLPEGLTDYELLRYITDEIIGEPKLKNTAPVRAIFRALCTQTPVPGSVQPITRGVITDWLNKYIHKKNSHEKQRLDHVSNLNSTHTM